MFRKWSFLHFFFFELKKKKNSSTSRFLPFQESGKKNKTLTISCIKKNSLILPEAVAEKTNIEMNYKVQMISIILTKQCKKENS